MAEGLETSGEGGASETMPRTLALLYDEISGALRAQHDLIESLNGRAQQLLGFATVILAILAAVGPMHPSVGTRILYGIALPIFTVAAYYSGRGWAIRKWRDDPNALNLWDDYRLQSERDVRERVIANRRASLIHNQEELSKKLGAVKRAELLLYLGFVYVAAVLLYEVVQG